MRRHLALLAACAPTLFVPTSASAASTNDAALMTCTGDNTITYTPGITFEEQTVRIGGEDRATVCLDLLDPLEADLSFAAPSTWTLTS